MSGDREDPQQVGSAGEEAAKLLGALADWAKDAAQGVDHHIATGAAECTYCPICRTVHAVRGLSPEVKDQLAGAATTFLHTAAGLLASRGGASGAPGARDGVEHIRLDDQDDGGDWPEDTDPEEGDR